MKTGPRLLISALLVPAAVCLVPAAAASAGAQGGLLVPGVAISDAEFEVGAWCRYLVRDEYLGESDSTSIYIAVTAKTRGKNGSAWWVEVESGRYGAPPEERELVKLLISEGIRDLAPGDSLCGYVEALYIKGDKGMVEKGDPCSLDRLTLANPTLDSDWAVTHGETVDTPAGRFVGDRKHLAAEDKREIHMGRHKLVKNDTDVFEVWLSDKVPIFRLVRCDVLRVRDSRTVPPIPGIPDKGREESRTTAELVGFGHGASPLMAIE